MTSLAYKSLRAEILDGHHRVSGNFSIENVRGIVGKHLKGIKLHDNSLLGTSMNLFVCYT